MSTLHAPGECPQPDQCIPALEVITPVKVGDVYRHAVARVAFMNQLLRDERRPRLFERWDKAIGADELVDRLMVLIVASRLRSPPQREAAYAAGYQQWHQQVTDRFQTATIALSAMQFTRDELTLPWLWLPLELTDAYLRTLEGRIGGVPCDIEVSIHAEPAAPAIETTFRTRAGETLTSAVQRLDREYAAVRTRLLSASSKLAPGRLPAHPQGDDEEKPALHARWFYLVHVAGKSKRAIAKHDVVATKTIRDGITEAERVLSLTDYMGD